MPITQVLEVFHCIKFQNISDSFAQVFVAGAFFNKRARLLQSLVFSRRIFP